MVRCVMFKRSQDYCQKIDFIGRLPLDLFLRLSTSLQESAGTNFLQMSYFIARATYHATSIYVSPFFFLASSTEENYYQQYQLEHLNQGHHFLYNPNVQWYGVWYIPSAVKENN